MEMKKRSIAGCIILTLVTFGIYGIYWFVKLTNETNRLAPEEATMSGGLAFLVTICTLGIYGLYWGYKLGKKMDIISEVDFRESDPHDLRKSAQHRRPLPADLHVRLRDCLPCACTG